MKEYTVYYFVKGIEYGTRITTTSKKRAKELLKEMVTDATKISVFQF